MTNLSAARPQRNPSTSTPSNEEQRLTVRARSLSELLVFVCLVWLLPSTAHAQSIAFVQQNSATPQPAQTSVSVPFNGSQVAGDLNVVVVGWSDSTAQVLNVSDSKGNVYNLAVGPTIQSGIATQSIYYSKNIQAAAAKANSVTVTFTVAARKVDIRIAEYQGLDLSNPMDVAAAAQGNSTTSSAGPVATTSGNDLLFAANLVQSTTTAAGGGFTSRVITKPNGDIVEDQVVTTTGMYRATAPIKTGAWIMQMVAFRAGGPTITSITPASGPVGTAVTIAGSNFGATQGASTVTFNGTVATPTSWSATSVVVPVPAGATSGPVVVTVGGQASTGVGFTVTVAPSDLVLSKTHQGVFIRGQIGTYVLTATNVGFGTTTGTVSVSDTLPGGLTASNMTGVGWTCTLSTLTCTRNDSLDSATSYPAITLTVNVAATASSDVTNVATISGGGETNTNNDSTSDPTSIETFSVSPATAVLTPSQQQQFTVTSDQPQTVVWLVDGFLGGSASAGMISESGFYTASSTEGAHTITATTSDGSRSASVTIQVVTYSGTLTYHNDNGRTGQNLATSLTHASVNPVRFGKLATFGLDGLPVASPLLASNVTIPNLGLRNLVFVTTAHDSVYAFDADALTGSPVWQRSFTSPALGITSVPGDDVGCCGVLEVGITGTPAIDLAGGTLYVVAMTKENGIYLHRLHALDLANGNEKFGGPVVISASVVGSGDGSINNVLSFDSRRANQRPALLLVNGVVYIGFGANTPDVTPFHGWLLGYNATTLQQVMVFCSTPDGSGGGIWLSNSGPASDAAGNLYVITGNGTFDLNTGGRDYGDSFIKISPAGAVLDYFTPFNQNDMMVNDRDLGSSGPLLLPDQPGAHPHLVLNAGKFGSIYLVDRDNMGHYNPVNNNQIVQSFDPYFPGNFTAPVYFNGHVYFSAYPTNIEMFTISNGLLSQMWPRSAEVFQYPGGSMAISANGTADGILWALQRNGSSPAVLFAYDALDLSSVLYSSAASGTRDTLDAATKFSVPLVAKNKVFVATTSTLTVFGLLP
jgi:hypothetical protein